MKCPLDTDTDLVMTDRHGIEIDYCPSCRGVWLDRGELDKLIERGAAALPRPAAPLPAPVAADRRSDDGRHRDDRDDRSYDDRKKKKRSSFLGEIFDF